MACAGVRKIKHSLTLNDKIEILRIYDSTEGAIKVNELAKTLKISRSTLLTIVNNRTNIENAPESDRCRYRTRNKRDNPQAGKSKYLELDEALAAWVREIKSKGEPFSGVILRQKALKLAVEMGFTNFTASNGWTDRFKKKYNFEYKSKPCLCKNKERLKDKPEETNYGVTTFLDKLVDEIKTDRSRNLSDENNTKKTFLEIEKRLIQWLEEAKKEKRKLNGILLKEMALSVAGVLGATKFKASSGWLNRFQKKYNVFQCKKCETYSNMGMKMTDDSESGNTINMCHSVESPQSPSKPDYTEEEYEQYEESLQAEETSEDSQDETSEESLKEVQMCRKRKKETNDYLIQPKQKRIIDLSEMDEKIAFFKELAKKIDKGKEYKVIEMRLNKVEVELEVLRMAKQLLRVKQSNLKLEVDNIKMRLHILRNS